MWQSAHQIWFSGVSAMLKVQHELGRQLAESVRVGAPTAESSNITPDPSQEGGRAAARSKDSVQQLAERAFESRLKPLLARRDVASRAEIENLAREVEALTRRVEALCREREGSQR